MHKLLFWIISLFIIIGIFYNISKIQISAAPFSFAEDIENIKELKGERYYDKMVFINEDEYSVQVVGSVEDRKKGLSKRDYMCDRCGMLFTFEDSDYRSFWMKDMLFDIDIIFIDENGSVVEMFENVKKDNPEIIVRSGDKVKYVLELNAGEVSKSQISVGDWVRF